MKDYDPKNWYWRVADSITQVYSSVIGDYVPVDNATYVAWKGDGTNPTRIGSEAELGEVLAGMFMRPAGTPSAAAVLDAYKDKQATQLTVEVVAKVTFNHENRIRVLEGRAPVNAAQFKQALKDLL